MSHIIKRKVVLEDFAQIGPMLEKNGRDFKPIWTAKRTAQQIDLFSKGIIDAFVLVDKKLDKVVGYVSYSTDPKYFTNYISKHKIAKYLIPGNFMCGVLQVIMIDPLYRKMGLGLKLTKIMVKDLHKKGADFVYFIRHEKNFGGKIIDALIGVRVIASFIDPWRGEPYLKTRVLVKGISRHANKFMKILEKANILQYPLSKKEQNKLKKR